MKHVLVILVAGIIGISSAAVSQTVEKKESKKPTNYFFTKLGHDTTAVEEFFMDSHELQGTSVARAPRLAVRKYSAMFNDDGTLKKFHIEYRRLTGPAFSEREYTYTNDSVSVMNRQDTVTTKYSVATTEHPFPLFYDIFAGWQASIQHAMKETGKKGFAILAGKQIYHYTVQGTMPGKLELTEPSGDFSPLQAEMDKEGRLERFDLTATTDKVVTERTTELTVKDAVLQYSMSEKTGKSFGILSPRDSVHAMINGAKVLIDYGRPSMRGRTIFGQVVPWDVVWRTGANAATQLVTDKDLIFGTTVVPAGTHTLFSLPSQSGWKLIINNQHGQWGTDYDQSKDLARLPLEVKSLADPVEQFTFDITTEGAGGTIHLKWEKTEASIPFTVK